VKLAYRPFGLLVSVLSGLAAGAIFRRLWRVVGNEETAPSATDPDRSWGEIAVAAALEGAVFGVVRAVIDRAGATGYARATGTWPD
jgi:hypothetical protein